MIVEEFEYTCGRCAAVFAASGTVEGYGRFLLRSAGGDIAILDANVDPAWEDAERLLGRVPEYLALPDHPRADVFQRVVVPLLYDPDGTGAPYEIDADPTCPACGHRATSYFRGFGPARLREVDPAPLTSGSWFPRSEDERVRALRDAVTAARLPEDRLGDPAARRRGAAGGASVVDLSSGRARLEEWGEVEFLDAGGVRVRLVDDSEVVVGDRPSMPVASGVRLWFDRVGVLVVAGTVAKRAYRVDLATLAVDVEELVREQDPGHRHLRVHPAGAHGAVLLYEGGLLRYELGGGLAWHVLHGDLSARVAALTADGVVVETQWPPERSGSTRVFRWADGAESGG